MKYYYVFMSSAFFNRGTWSFFFEGADLGCPEDNRIWKTTCPTTNITCPGQSDMWTFDPCLYQEYGTNDAKLYKVDLHAHKTSPYFFSVIATSEMADFLRRPLHDITNGVILNLLWHIIQRCLCKVSQHLHILMEGQL